MKGMCPREGEREEAGGLGRQENELGNDAPPAGLTSAMVRAEAPVACRSGSAFQGSQLLAVGVVDEGV